MKEELLTITLILVSLLRTAQDDRTTIGLTIYPGISTITNPVENQEFSRFSLSGGVEFRQPVYKNKIFISSGLYIFNHGFNFEAEGTDENGNILGLFTGEDIHNHLTLPISAIFKFGHFYAGAGMNMNYYLNRKTFLGDELILSQRDFFQKKVSYGFQFIGGFEFAINEHFVVGTELFVNSFFNQPLINYGLGIGLKYAFLNKEL